MTTVLHAREPRVSYHQWTVSDYYRMAAAGVLSESDRVELIDGEVIDMAPIGSRHAYLVDRLAAAFRRNGSECLVRVQNPVRLDEYNEPQPDIALLKDKSYMDAHPTAEDVFLIVEVSDTTSEYDRDVKLSLYARHGIPEVWLVDVNARELTVYREPAEGQYRLIRKPTATEAVSPVVMPGVVITLAEVWE